MYGMYCCRRILCHPLEFTRSRFVSGNVDNTAVKRITSADGSGTAGSGPAEGNTEPLPAVAPKLARQVL